MEKYYEFVKRNTPASVTIPWDMVMEIVSNLGLKIQDSEIVEEKTGNNLFVDVGESFLLKYRAHRGEEGLVYGLHFVGRSHTWHPGTKSIPRQIVECLGYSSVVVALPEPVVCLPIPRWLGSSVMGYEACEEVVASREMFLSEARAELKLYTEQAAAMMEGVSSTP